MAHPRHQGFHWLIEGSVAIRVKLFPHLARQRGHGVLVPLVPWCWLREDDHICFHFCHVAWCHVGRFKSIRRWGVWIWCGSERPWSCYKGVLWSEEEVWIYCGLNRAHNCRNVRSTIIESDGKSRWYLLFSLLQTYSCFLDIYIKQHRGSHTLLYSLNIQLSQCYLWLSSACSMLKYSRIIAILVQVRADVNDLATPKYMIDWWGAELFIGVA